MFIGTLLFLFSKIILVISIGKDLLILNSSILKKRDKNVLIDISTFLCVNGFLIFIYYFFFQGFNLLHQLFIEGNLVQAGNVGGIISTIGGYWLITNLYSRYGIFKTRTKLESLSRLLFYPAASFLVYSIIYVVSNVFIYFLRTL